MIVVVTINRKQRILIAAVAVVGILFVCGAKWAGNSQEFFDFLAKHPTASSVARPVFTLVGMEDDFNRQLGEAQLRSYLWERLPPE